MRLKEVNMPNLSLTTWWDALIDDLDRLAPRMSNNDTPAYNATRAMADIGKTIEENLLAAVSKGPQIETISQQLGYTYHNPVAKKNNYLPVINTPDDLLFAIV